MMTLSLTLLEIRTVSDRSMASTTETPPFVYRT